MSEQTQSKALTITNYDKIRAMANNQATIQRFVEMLGNRTTAHSYITSAMLAVQNSKDLMECTPSSVFNVVMRAAALHLSCDPALKQAYIVPFYDNKTGKRNASFIPGYIGINQMAHRTNLYRYLNTSELWEGQEFCVNQLTGQAHLEGLRKSDKVLGYFHYFELFTGMNHTYYMTVEELEAYHQRYASKNPIWKSHFPDMCKKTVTKQNLLKFGILDSNDRAILEEVTDDRPEGELMRDDTIEGVFSEQDDRQAEVEAKIAAEAKASEPQRPAQEIIGEISDQPAETPKEAPAPDQFKPNGHKRPFPPEIVKQKIEATTKQLEGKELSKNDRNMIAVNIEMCFAGDANSEEMRHGVLKYLTGSAHVKDLTPAQVLAIKRWVDAKPDSGGEFLPNIDSAKEAMLIWLEHLKSQGQESLI